MYIICLFTAFFACVLGKICGMGGGVIIKPVLDAIGAADVSAINFLSGCTVLGMSLWSVGKAVAKGNTELDFKVSTPLAIGAAIGGILGKALFSRVSGLFPDANTAGGVQAVLLFLAVLATLIYTLRKNGITSRQVSAFIPCLLIGTALGTLGSFLGIGGGPFNMAVLYYFFSMSTKTAALNSLYVILISQAAGMAKTFLSGSVPEVALALLVGMVLCGILGSELGGRINKRLTEEGATKLFEGAMLLVMAICVYNALKFLVF